MVHIVRQSSYFIKFNMAYTTSILLAPHPSPVKDKVSQHNIEEVIMRDHAFQRGFATFLTYMKSPALSLCECGKLRSKPSS